MTMTVHDPHAYLQSLFAYNYASHRYCKGAANEAEAVFAEASLEMLADAAEASLETLADAEYDKLADFATVCESTPALTQFECGGDGGDSVVDDDNDIAVRSEPSPVLTRSRSKRSAPCVAVVCTPFKRPRRVRAPKLGLTH